MQAADRHATRQQPTRPNQLATSPQKPTNHNSFHTKRQKKNLTFIPSLNPNNRPNVPSTSTPGTSCSCLGPALRVCERMPVHPKNTEDCLPAFPSLPAACLKLSSTTTFCTTALEFSSTLTSDAGRLSRQFLRPGRRATSAWVEEGGLRVVEAILYVCGFRL